jgi:uncharacterized protein (TIGR02246 family)
MPVRTPREFDELFAAAFNSWNADALLELYEPGARWVTEPGQSVSGHEAMRATALGYFDMKPVIDLNTMAVLEAGDIAVVYSSWTFTANGPDGNPIDMVGNSTVVLRRQQDSSWLCAIDDPWSSG